MTVVLLVVALTASAQEVTKGTIKSGNNKVEMSYSFEGGKVTKQYSGTGSASYTYEVEEGATLKFSCSKIKGTESLRIVIDGKDTKGKSSASMNYQVPKGKNSFNVRLEGTTEDDDDNGEYIILPSAIDDEDDFSDLVVEITCKVKKPKQKKTFKVENAKKYLCPHCHQKDSKIRFNDLYGEVKIRCSLDDNAPFEFAEDDTEIFEDDLIKTEEESGAILGLEDMSTYYIGPETELIIHTEEKNISKLEMLVGSMWANFNRMREGKNLEIEMSQCVAGRNGTIFAFEETGNLSKIWLFAGTSTVTNKKTGKKTVLQPGQNIACKGSQSDVKSFNIEEGAKKFGIKMEDIRNHYTNQKQTTTATTTSAPKGKYARYGVKCGIVKRVVTTAKDRTYTTTWFDDYGRLERSENTKKETKSGNKWVSAPNYKFVTIIKDDKQYRLDPDHKRGSTYSLSTVTNFLNPKKMVQGYGVQKTNGKATVGNRQCDVFKGKEMKLAGDATVEHYVWQGIPLKSVEKAPDGTTTTTLQSIELPNSIDASKFEIPKGYTVK